MGYCLVYATFANHDEARQVALQLMEARLVACINIFPAITAVYRWQGKIEQGQEVAALIKTKDELFDEITNKIKELHSYETCCVIKLPITAGSEQFLSWIDTQCQEHIERGEA